MPTCAYCDTNAVYRDRASGAYLCPVHARLEVTGPRGEAPRPPLTIRPATPADRPRIAELADYFWGETEVECFGWSITAGLSLASPASRCGTRSRWSCGCERATDYRHHDGRPRRRGAGDRG